MELLDVCQSPAGLNIGTSSSGGLRSPFFQAYRFLNTSWIDTQGMKKNTPTASLVSNMPQ